MDYVIKLQSLNEKLDKLKDINSNVSEKTNSITTSLDSITSSDLGNAISSCNSLLERLKNGCNNSENWFSEYLMTLNQEESNLTSTAEDITPFTGEFENIFAKITIPTLKSNISSEELQIQFETILPSTVTGNPNEAEIYKFLAKQGFNNAAICGILANIEAESSFKTQNPGDGGTSDGICQWHDGSDVHRLTDLKNYCAEKGLDWTSTNGQLEFLMYELKNKYSGLYNTLLNVPNTEEGARQAAEAWTYDFERPSNTELRAQERGELATSNYWSNYSSVQNTSVNLSKPTNTTGKTTNTTKSSGEISQTALEELNSRYNSLTRGNYNNECPRVVNDVLVGAGVISSSDGENMLVNGKDLAHTIYNTYNNNSNYNVSNTTITNGSNAAQEFANFVNENGNENIVLSFSRGWPVGSGDDGTTYGHTMMISKIEDGKVYCIDNATVLDSVANNTGNTKISNGNGAYEYVVNYDEFLNSGYFNGQPVLSEVTIINKKSQ